MKPKKTSISGNKLEELPVSIGLMFAYETEKIPTKAGCIAPSTILDYTSAGFEYFCDAYYGGSPYRGDIAKEGWRSKERGWWISTDDSAAIKHFSHKSDEKESPRNNLQMTERAAQRAAMLGMNVSLIRYNTTTFTRETIHHRSLRCRQNLFHGNIELNDTIALISDTHKTEERKSGSWSSL